MTFKEHFGDQLVDFEMYQSSKIKVVKFTPKRDFKYFLTDADSVTNGYWLIVKESIPVNLAKRLEKIGVDSSQKGRYSDKRIIPSYNDECFLKPVYVIKGFTCSTDFIENKVIFKTRDGGYCAVNGNWYFYLSRNIPNLKLHAENVAEGLGVENAIKIFSGGNFVGLIMPVRIANETLYFEK